MLLTISAEGNNSNILSFLLHKHPDKLQTAELSVGKAHVFYPEYSQEKTTAALLLEIDPVGMVRNAKNFTGKEFLLGQYVNDRPYVASSFMSSAISKVFSSALNGNCKEHPEYVEEALSLTVKISVIPAPRGGELLIKNLFEPLGYSIEAERHILDTKFTDWGYGKYFTLILKNKLPIKDLLSHLYVLIPVLDNEKHYFITQDEVDKLLQKGKGCLENHPSKDFIVSRYLINIKSLVRSAFNILATEGAVHTDKNHEWHMENIKEICLADKTLFKITPYKIVDVENANEIKDAVDWWLSLTQKGGEGMVIKPFDFVFHAEKYGLVQPAVKCRGKEYLRIIYGPEYCEKENLDRLKKRGLAKKRALALQEFALGVEALERFVKKEPLRRVHESAFAVLALESEAVDPRL